MKHNSQPSHHNRLTKKAVAPILAIAALTACTANAQPSSESSVNKIPVVSTALPEHTLPNAEQAPQPTATTESVIDLSSVMVRQMRNIADNMNGIFTNNDYRHQYMLSSETPDGIITNSVTKYNPTDSGFERYDATYTYETPDGGPLKPGESAIVSSVQIQKTTVDSVHEGGRLGGESITLKFVDGTNGEALEIDVVEPGIPVTKRYLQEPIRGAGPAPGETFLPMTQYTLDSYVNRTQDLITEMQSFPGFVAQD